MLKHIIIFIVVALVIYWVFTSGILHNNFISTEFGKVKRAL